MVAVEPYLTLVRRSYHFPDHSCTDVSSNVFWILILRPFFLRFFLNLFQLRTLFLVKTCERLTCRIFFIFFFLKVLNIYSNPLSWNYLSSFRFKRLVPFWSLQFKVFVFFEHFISFQEVFKVIWPSKRVLFVNKLNHARMLHRGEGRRSEEGTHQRRILPFWEE